MRSEGLDDILTLTFSTFVGNIQQHRHLVVLKLIKIAKLSY